LAPSLLREEDRGWRGRRRRILGVPGDVAGGRRSRGRRGSSWTNSRRRWSSSGAPASASVLSWLSVAWRKGRRAGASPSSPSIVPELVPGRALLHRQRGRKRATAPAAVLGPLVGPGEIRTGPVVFSGRILQTGPAKFTSGLGPFGPVLSGPRAGQKARSSRPP
jgi:hypothetical protein